MRILLVSLHHVEYAVELAQALGEKHRVHLVLRKEKVSQTMGAGIYQQIGGNVSCTQLPYQSMKHPSIIYVLFLIFSLHFRFRPDVIHIQESVNPLNFLFLLLRSKLSVLTVHDVTFHPGTPLPKKISMPLKIRLFKKSRRRSKRIIVHGEKLKEKFIKEFERLAADIAVVRHGSLFSFIPAQNNQIDEEPHTVLFFGRIQHYKGLKYLIDAEPLVSKALPDFKIIVAGIGDDIEKYRSALVANVHFEVHERFIPNDEVAHFFSRAALIVLPYIEASQSGIAAMAFAFGKPVIATNVGSIPEMVEHNHTGIIVPPKDKNALSRAIIELLQNTAKRKKLSLNARQAALTKFSWKHVAMLTARCYRQAIATNAKTMN